MGRWRRGYRNGREDKNNSSRQKEGYGWNREKVGDRRDQNRPLTLIVAPEGLILGFLGVEVFQLSKIPDSVSQ